MLSRRSFIAAMVAAVSGPSWAIGVRGIPMLGEEIWRLDGIVEGTGPTVHALVAPGCDAAGELWEGSRGFVGQLSFRWIPVFEGSASGRGAVARCLEEKTPQAVADLLMGRAGGEISSAAASAADIQDGTYRDVVAKLLWESTGRTPAMPTLVYGIGGRRIQVIRGSIGADRFPEVVAGAV